MSWLKAEIIPTYEYVSQTNRYMEFARDIARCLFKVWGWNEKTTPVCVLVDKEQNIVSWAACADGAHALQRHCDRSGTQGTSYNDCEWCRPEKHAEALALSRTDARLKGGTAYLWGHYKMCSHCVALLYDAGITRLVLLNEAERLFDRHRIGNLIGRPEQFIL